MPADRDHGEPAGWPPLRELLVAGAAFGLLTILATWPQARHLATHTGTHYDALFSVWRMAWVAHQLPADPLHLFDGWACRRSPPTTS